MREAFDLESGGRDGCLGYVVVFGGEAGIEFHLSEKAKSIEPVLSE